MAQHPRSSMDSSWAGTKAELVSSGSNIAVLRLGRCTRFALEGFSLAAFLVGFEALAADFFPVFFFATDFFAGFLVPFFLGAVTFFFAIGFYVFSLR